MPRRPDPASRGATQADPATDCSGRRVIHGARCASASSCAWAPRMILARRADRVDLEAERLRGALRWRLRQGAADQDSANFRPTIRSEEHTSELQSLMRISYAVF